MQHYVTWFDDAEWVVYPEQNQQKANVEQRGKVPFFMSSQVVKM